jgi:hypothetical protein
MPTKPITSNGYDNEYTLCDGDGQPAYVGQEVTSFRGDKCVLQGGSAPHKSSSTGRVYTGASASSMAGESYPSVYGLKWVRSSEVDKD